MKRILIALGVGVALFAIVAFAAGTFAVNSSLASGSQDPIESCTTNVSVSYLTAWNNAADRFEVTNVEVTVAHAACNGKYATVELTGSGDGIASAGPGLITALTTGWMPVTPAQPVSAVTDVHVVIH